MAYTNNIKSIAIGSFDGIHIAHQTLIDKADALVIIERNGGYLTPGYKRTHFTSKVCCFYHFDVIKNLTPKAFVEMLCRDFPKLKTIVIGYDFIFGKDRAGDIEDLQALFDGTVEIVQEIEHEGISVHSRTIKAYLHDGNIKMANILLGRAYSIEGNIIHGQGLGTRELVPTLNLDIKEYQIPLSAVYASRTEVNGEWLDSVSFIGHRVSADGDFAVETHILDKNIGTIIIGIVKIAFIASIRENRKFENLEDLKEQILLDIAKAKELLC